MINQRAKYLPELFDMSSEDSILCKETLDLLEWPRLCDHLSTFASTPNGQLHCKNLFLPNDLGGSRCLSLETIEIAALDDLLDGGLSFKGVHGLAKTLNHCLKGGVASGEELLFIAETLSAARRLRRQIEENELRPTLSSLFVPLVSLPDLEKCLKFGIEEGGRVADRASQKLADLRGKSQEVRIASRDLLQDFVRRFSSLLQDNIVLQRHGRCVLAVKAGAANQIPGLVHDSSASGHTLFIEPQAAIPLGNRLRELEARIREEEQILLRKWSAMVGENFSSLSDLDRVLLKVDLALARARYGRWLGGVPARFEDDADAAFIFKDLRHPLLVWQQKREQGRRVVPTTVEAPSSIKVVAITGPNTGGKTVTLKSIGLAVLMARAGLLLPCKGIPSLPWCAQIFADIGDEQSIQQNLSTFSGHIKRIARILKAVVNGPTPSIVLLDEVGAGTDPSEGNALAIALLEELANRTRLTVATTHYGEIKALKYADQRFENASVAFNAETLSPTFELQWGIPGRSNALSISKRLGIAEKVIERANQLLGLRGDVEVNDVIRGLEEQRKRQQEAAEAAVALLARTELLHEELLKRWEIQNERSAQAQEIAREKLAESIRSGQEEVRQLIHRLRQEGADGEVARQVGKRLRRLQSDYLPTPDSINPNKKGWIPQIGEKIRLLPFGKSGEVIGISDDGAELTVQCGVLRSKLSLSAVESLDGLKPEKSLPKAQFSSTHAFRNHPTVRTKRNTIDVRGLRVHEAEAVVEECLRHSNGPIWVVHGIGSGKLKRGLHEWLQTLPYVARFSDADQPDGGVGCTVVWLD